MILIKEAETKSIFYLLTKSMELFDKISIRVVDQYVVVVIRIAFMEWKNTIGSQRLFLNKFAQKHIGFIEQFFSLRSCCFFLNQLYKSF